MADTVGMAAGHLGPMLAAGAPECPDDMWGMLRAGTSARAEPALVAGALGRAAGRKRTETPCLCIAGFP